MGNEQNEKENDIGRYIEPDFKLSLCKLCNENNFVYRSLSVIDNTLGKKKEESTEQNESGDKKEELGNGAHGRKNDTGVKKTMTRV